MSIITLNKSDFSLRLKFFISQYGISDFQLERIMYYLASKNHSHTGITYQVATQILEKNTVTGEYIEPVEISNYIEANYPY